MEDQQKPPSFPNLPKSALFSRLEAFLPVMAEENKKLSKAVASGEGDKHNIEVEENEENSGKPEDDAVAGDGEKKEDYKAPVIEMNFALGTMSSDGEGSNAIDQEAQIKAATIAKVIRASSEPTQQQDESLFRMQLERPSNKPRPVIQELN
ncbi:unnamed protein product [Peronospora destructor]|uniref:Uncharacterized protein n=1 Tax=Peronospora destructor TaxID=86335 RepID=A0AAV0TCE1_9STRA|nr:unnamed protein product [Peronospora destructor]CAI5740929.1 unnamed protein product [Peronospora destructor]